LLVPVSFVERHLLYIDDDDAVRSDLLTHTEQLVLVGGPHRQSLSIRIAGIRMKFTQYFFFPLVESSRVRVTMLDLAVASSPDGNPVKSGTSFCCSLA
jgi:hypothetical protein